MPLMYNDMGVIASHLHTRQHCSLFDVSHMLQTTWKGRDASKFLESLVVGDILSLKARSSILSLFTTNAGGILDDCVINHKDKDEYYVVSNAGCADKVWQHVSSHLKKFQDQGGDVDIQKLDNHSLLALQGPTAHQVLKPLVDLDLSRISFMTSIPSQIKDMPVYISRCGYTGEDGFEISVANQDVETLAKLLTKLENVKLSGLAARDSLRIEAALCLYGQDIDENISPVEAGLTWTIAKARRDLERANFPGQARILGQIKTGVDKRRVGILFEGAPARAGAEIWDALGSTRIGEVTSGCPSPVLKKNVAMGYVANGFHKAETPLQVKVRNRLYPGKIVKMPFVPHSYYKI